MKITNLTINHLVTPMGYDLGTPRASYLIEGSAGKAQVRRRITVRTDRTVYDSGVVETVGTDESWLVWPSNITYSTIYDGEHVDDTLMPEPPAAARLLEGKMLPLSDRYSPPVRIQQTIRPIALIHTPAGEQVFDLGQNMSGVFRLHIRGKKGQKVHIQVGEVLQDGNFYRENLRSAKAEFFYTCGDGAATVQPKFTYYGFRYVKVSGVEVMENDLEGLVYYSNIWGSGTSPTISPRICPTQRKILGANDETKGGHCCARPFYCNTSVNFWPIPLTMG